MNPLLLFTGAVAGGLILYDAVNSKPALPPINYTPPESQPPVIIDYDTALKNASNAPITWNGTPLTGEQLNTVRLLTAAYDSERDPETKARIGSELNAALQGN